MSQRNLNSAIIVSWSSFVDLQGMASVSVSYVVGWENNRKRIVWLFCFSFTFEANRPAFVLAVLYYQCSDAGGIYAF